MTTTSTRPTFTTLDTSLAFIGLSALEAMYTEALETWNEAIRASARTTVAEGFTFEQFAAAAEQERAAAEYCQAIYNAREGYYFAQDFDFMNDFRSGYDEETIPEEITIELPY